LKYNHIIEGTAALNDVGAAPLLRSMLDQEPDLSRRLTIAGALWKLTRDRVFPELLRESVGFGILRARHLYQVLWLDDGCAVDILVDLLGDKDWTLTLGLLNELEFGRRMLIPAREMPHQREYYREHRNDPVLRAALVSAIQKHNRESKNGW
jgi:hypothetical protein